MVNYVQTINIYQLRVRKSGFLGKIGEIRPKLSQFHTAQVQFCLLFPKMPFMCPNLLLMSSKPTCKVPIIVKIRADTHEQRERDFRCLSIS